MQEKVGMIYKSLFEIIYSRSCKPDVTEFQLTGLFIFLYAISNNINQTVWPWHFP